jgi:hypothetical protein
VEQELSILSEGPPSQQMQHVLEYVEYVFRGDDPEGYLEGVFPHVWELYCCYKRGGQGEATAAYLADKRSELAKELAGIRTEIVDWFKQQEK